MKACDLKYASLMGWSVIGWLLGSIFGSSLTSTFTIAGPHLGLIIAVVSFAITVSLIVAGITILSQEDEEASNPDHHH